MAYPLIARNGHPQYQIMPYYGECGVTACSSEGGQVPRRAGWGRAGRIVGSCALNQAGALALTPEAHWALRQKGTERVFTGPYVDAHDSRDLSVCQGQLGTGSERERLRTVPDERPVVAIGPPVSQPAPTAQPFPRLGDAR